MLLKPFNVTLANGASTCLSHAPQALQCCPCQQCLHMSVTFIPNPFFATPPHPFLMPHLFPSLLLPPPVLSSSPPALLDVQNFDVKTVLCASSTMLLLVSDAVMVPLHCRYLHQSMRLTWCWSQPLAHPHPPNILQNASLAKISSCSQCGLSGGPKLCGVTCVHLILYFTFLFSFSCCLGPAY